MSLRLIRPGGRKGNQFWIVRGTLAGRRIEVSTKARDREAAERFKAKLELRLLDRLPPGRSEAVTFRQAAIAYKAFRSPSKGDCNRIAKIEAVLGNKLVTEITHADLVATANRLYPDAVAATKNRGVMKPAAAILHYAARNGWCERIIIERFKEPPPETRASSAETAQTILAAIATEEKDATTERERRAAVKKRLLILWLFCHWSRISDALRVDWNHVDLTERTYRIYISKPARWKIKPISSEVWQALANDPERVGPLFPWRTRSGVYKWLRPLVRRLNIVFTPHMARHYGGKELNRTGAGLKTIMEHLDQVTPEMAARYQDADAKISRQAMESTRPILGKSRGKSTKKRRNA